MLASLESKIILALGIVIILMGGALWLEESRISTLNTTVGSLQQSVKECSDAVAVTNKAIEDGKAAADKRKKEAQDAVDAAKKEAKSARSIAASILAKKAPAGVNECAAASQEFDKELKQERGVQ
jgi:HPt (histidine-containing phosphotransfer) domain-containing protein